MEYGIYMGARKADSEKDFLDSVNTTFIKDPHQTLVFYINAEKLINYVDEIRNKNRIQSTLIYFNTSWNYGIFNEEEDSILYDGKISMILFVILEVFQINNYNFQKLSFKYLYQ